LLKDIPHRRQLLVFLGLVAFFHLSIARDLSHWNHGNEWSRIVTTFALVEHGTFAINAYSDVETGDWSRFEGNTYSNKAPGPAVLAAPFYLLQYLVEKIIDVQPSDWRARNTALYLARLTTTTLPTLFALLLLFLVLVRRYELAPFPALLVCGGWALGSLGFLYSVVYFGHQTAAAFFAIGMCLSLLDDKKLLWAGLSMGVAVASDYICILPVAGWTAWLFYTHRSWKKRKPWILGGGIVAVLLLLYHRACFGSFFATPYSDGIVNPQWRALNTTVAPDFKRLTDITVRPWRGLFYCTPLWALALVTLDGIRKEKKELMVAAGTILVFFFYLTMLPSSFGGWCIGPRYFVCALPLMALLLIRPARELPRLYVALLAISVGMMLVAALVDPLAAEQFKDPFREYLIPLMEQNGDSPQANLLGHLLGLTRMQSWVAYMLLFGGAWVWLWRSLRSAK
jgi:hypothetical protein